MSVGLLVVSHSKHLAIGVVELAHALAGDEVALMAVGPEADSPTDGLGVNASMVVEALKGFVDVDEIGVIGDVGSSFLAASAAIELAEVEDRVRIIDAPMVEGAIACAMAVSMGASLNDVVAAGENAWEVRKLGT